MRRLLVVQQYQPPGSFQDRQRGVRYASLLREAGFEPQYVGRHPMPLEATTLPAKAWNRARDIVLTPRADARILQMARDADIVLLLKVDEPKLMRGLRRRPGTRVVFDLADRIWLDPRGSLRQDVVDMIASADAITVDNSFGLAFARRLGPPVHVWPSAAYLEEFDAIRAGSRRDADDRIVLGWIGSHTTAANLLPIADVLEGILARHPAVEIRLYGVPPGHEIARRLEGPRVHVRSSYDTQEMLEVVLDTDIGLYPMPDSDDAAMHGVTKGVIYMAGGAVVVASPVADVAKLVEDDVTGLCARTPAEWSMALERLIDDAALRARLRAQALTKVREGHSLRACFEGLRSALEVAP